MIDPANDNISRNSAATALLFCEGMMYTIYTMIERLLNLKEIAVDGGDTPIVINEGDSESDLEHVACDLQKAKVVSVSAATGKPVNWRVSRVKNDCEVVRVY